MRDMQREILSQVAAGKISATEGAERLDAIEAVRASNQEALPEPPPPAPQPRAPEAKQVRVISQFGSAEIVGDPSVAFAVADGPHRARQDGDTMVIEHVAFDEDESFSFGGSRRVVVNGFDFGRRNLSVRMNPDLALNAVVQAGNVRIEGVHGPISGEVQAGNCKVRDFRSALNLIAQAGNITASGRLDSGASKIRCEMGSVKISLEKGSSVRVTARSNMGKVTVEGRGGADLGRSGRDVTIGSGTGSLDVECTMGNVKVYTD